MRQIKFTTMRLFVAAILLCAVLPVRAQNDEAEKFALQALRRENAGDYAEVVSAYLQA